jgi:hypothetical protein
MYIHIYIHIHSFIFNTWLGLIWALLLAVGVNSPALHFHYHQFRIIISLQLLKNIMVHNIVLGISPTIYANSMTWSSGHKFCFSLDKWTLDNFWTLICSVCWWLPLVLLHKWRKVQGLGEIHVHWFYFLEQDLANFIHEGLTN